MPETTTIEVTELRTACEGEVLSPGNGGFDAARQAFNLMVDQSPAAVALPATADDVAKVVRFAREHGKRVAPQRTGHNAGALGSRTTPTVSSTRTTPSRWADQRCSGFG